MFAQLRIQRSNGAGGELPAVMHDCWGGSAGCEGEVTDCSKAVISSACQEAARCRAGWVRLGLRQLAPRAPGILGLLIY